MLREYYYSVTSKFPAELEGFLKNPWGKSLIIRGQPGSGKTTLALEIMENIFTPNNSVYLSTRVGDQSIYNQFPWVKDSDARNRIIDAGKKFLRTINPPVEKNKNSVLISGTEVLMSLTNQIPDKVITYNLDALGINSPEIERSIDSLNLIIKNRPVFVIDSIEGIASKLNVNESKLVFAIQKDFVEASGINVVFVSEASESNGINQLDYLVDGVISLKKDYSDSRILRSMRMEKLRYTQIESTEYFYSLNNGRFNFIPPIKYLTDTFYDAKGDPDNFLKGMDLIEKSVFLGERKSTIAINLVGIKSDIIYSIIAPIIIKALQDRKGVILIPEPDVDPEKIFLHLSSLHSLKEYEDNLKIIDLSNDISTKKYVPALGQTKIEERLREYMRIIVEMSDQTEGILFVEVSRGLEKLEGVKMNSEMLTNLLSSIRSSMDTLLYINQNKEDIPTINQMFRVILNVERIGNSIISYGEIPYTPYYGVCIDEDGKIRFELVS